MALLLNVITASVSVVRNAEQEVTCTQYSVFICVQVVFLCQVSGSETFLIAGQSIVLMTAHPGRRLDSHVGP